MWKYVSRRIRDTIERSANYFDKRHTTGVTNAQCNSFNDNNKDSFTPCRWFTPRKCWHQFQDNTNTNSKKWNFEHLNSSWIGAITWSSALVLGYYATKLIHLKQKYRNRNDANICPPVHYILQSLSPYVYCVNKNPLLLTKPNEANNILNNFSSQVHLISNDFNKHSGIENTQLSHSESESTSSENSLTYLDDVLNSIENRLGLNSIEHGQLNEGLNLLRSAASRNHPPAQYNLGLCYEQGVGVKTDEKMEDEIILSDKCWEKYPESGLIGEIMKTAMELYRSAAASEHPGALYNLGIYYGQGRGGLTRDLATATRLLRLAAVKGQVEAINALKSLEIDTTEEVKPPNRYFNFEEQIAPTQSSLFVDNALHTVNCEVAGCY